MKTCVNLTEYLSKFFKKWKTFQTEVLKKIKTHTLYVQYLPPPRNGAVYKIMWTNMVESYNPQMTVHGAQKMPFPFRVTRASIYTHTHTLIICILYLLFSAVEMVTLYVQCLSYYKIQVGVSKLYRYERNKNGTSYHELKIVKCQCNNLATQ